MGSTARDLPSVQTLQASRSWHSLPAIPQLTPNDLQHSTACIVSNRKAAVRERSSTTAPALVIRRTCARQYSPMSSPLRLNRRSALLVAAPDTVRVTVSFQLPSHSERLAVRHSVMISSALPHAREQPRNAKLVWIAWGK